jgi:NTP pyrophosphatase (non-canonical NTP hydrolase)
MAYLPEHPTLIDLQNYIDEVCKERGWVKDTYAEKFLLFTEEVGELANYFQIDLEQAFREKEQVNQNRTWE